MVFHTVGDVLEHTVRPTPTDPITVQGGVSFPDALARMTEDDIWQMPVSQDGVVTGVITPRAINEVLDLLSPEELQSVSAGTVAESPSTFVAPDAELYDLFERFAADSYVLVGSPEQVEGILTHADVFGFLTTTLKPFLLIGDIELALRETFEAAFGDLETRIQETFERRDLPHDPPDSVNAFSFRDYRAFIGINWEEGLSAHFTEDRSFVDNRLEDVQDIRNAIFHFRETEIDRVEQRLELAHDCFTETNW